MTFIMTPTSDQTSRQDPHLSIRIVIWILPSDTLYLVMTCSVFVLTIQIERRQCCLQTRPDKTRVSNYKMYLSQIAKCICLKLQNVFVSNYKMYWSQIAKCIGLKLQNVLVSNCKMHLFQIAKNVLVSSLFIQYR